MEEPGKREDPKGRVLIIKTFDPLIGQIRG